LKGLIGMSAAVRISPYLPRFEGFDSTAVRSCPHQSTPMDAQMDAQDRTLPHFSQTKADAVAVDVGSPLPTAGTPTKELIAQPAMSSPTTAQRCRSAPQRMPGHLRAARPPTPRILERLVPLEERGGERGSERLDQLVELTAGERALDVRHVRGIRRTTRTSPMSANEPRAPRRATTSLRGRAGRDRCRAASRR
jgi:hypothetical protein